MVKQKIAAIAASVLAACSIGATAFAADYQSFGTVLLVEGEPGYATNYAVRKQDDLYGVVKVDSGLSRGDTFATFEIYKYPSLTLAAGPKDLWVNAKLQLPYKTGQGVVGDYYILRLYMEPQGNADTLTISGSWLP